MISVFISGKESLKFLKGVSQIVSPEDIPLNIIVDTFDFFEFYDIAIYPLLTNVFLLFMNQLNETQWTGKNRETLEIINFLQKVDKDFPSIREPSEVGDLFLAPNIFLTHRRNNNCQLSACAAEISKSITKAAIIPLSNDELKLGLNYTELGEVTESNQQRSSINSLFDAFESVEISNEAKTALLNSEVILLPKPSVLSILAFLKIPHIQEILKDAVGQIIFISPITDKVLDSVSLHAFKTAELTPSSVGLSKALRGLVDVYVIDPIEQSLINQITRPGMKVVSWPLNLDTPRNQLACVEFVLKLTPFGSTVESLDYKAKKEVDSLRHGLRKLAGGFKRRKSRQSSSDEEVANTNGL